MDNLQKNIMRVFSYGGGVQSNAVMVLQATGQIKPFDIFIFSNVGVDSENPATLEYIENHARPYMEKHSIEFVEVHKTMRDGTRETVKSRIMRTPRSIVIPMKRKGRAPYNHVCSIDFKQIVVNRWIKSQTEKCVIGIGMSIDEFTRARSTDWSEINIDGSKLGFNRRFEYPLINSGISRINCEAIIHDAKLPIPSRSACYFCPVTGRNEWIEMRRLRPDLFYAAVEIENHINTKRDEPDHNRLYIHRDLKPLEHAVGLQYHLPFPNWGMDECGSGACFL